VAAKVKGNSDEVVLNNIYLQGSSNFKLKFKIITQGSSKSKRKLICSSKF